MKDYSSGLLPKPDSQPTPNLHPEKYVGSSLFPLPFQAVLLLEGSSLLELVSWDLSVSTKSLKIKMDWSCDTKSFSGCSLNEKLPPNLIRSLCLHDLANPSWSISSSSSKISIRIEWPISKPVSAKSSINSSSIKQMSSPVIPQTPKSASQAENREFLDSGYKSKEQPVGCYGPNSQNWRQKCSPIFQPNFGSSSKYSKHDVFVNPDKSSPNVFRPLPTKDPSVSSESEIINSKLNLTTVKFDTLKVTPSSTVSKPSSISSPDVGSKVNDIPMNSQPTVSKTFSIPSDSSNENYHPKSTEAVLMINEEESNSSDDFPIPPPDFPKSFYPNPHPLPVMNDGFLEPETKACYMNLPGKCRLCNTKVSSYLIDLHLLQCSGLDRQPLDSFVQEVMKKTKLKRKKVVEAAIQFCKFELSEKTVPNKYFKNIDKFNFFSSELENIIQKLTKSAFRILNIPEMYENFNILKYTE